MLVRNSMLRWRHAGEKNRRRVGSSSWEMTLNTRPRKTLDWSTPAEALDRFLSSTLTGGVATTG